MGRKQRDAPGFKPGQSGNPRGRPKGARNKLTILAEKLLADEAEEVARSVLDAAKGGDMTAARLVLERIVPVRKGRPITLEMPPIQTAQDAAKAFSSVIAAVAAGELTPDEGQTIAGLFEVQRRTLETVEMEQRIAALERARGIDGSQ
jgi:hypothetical protein